MSDTFSKNCFRNELPAFFRSLADALEGSTTQKMLPGLSTFKKLKIGIKDDYGHVRIKLKFHTDRSDIDAPNSEEDNPAVNGKPNYKTLKKQMRSSFKAIYQAVHASQLPPEEAVTAFLEESRLMTQYPGFGDEYYAAYDTAVQSFTDAWTAQDLAAMHACVDALNHLKTDCHQRYK